jgi:hypothetical protein
MYMRIHAHAARDFIRRCCRQKRAPPLRALVWQCALARVCMYVYLYTYTYTCMYAGMPVCASECVCVYVRMSTYVCTHVFVCARAWQWIRMCVVYIWACMHPCISTEHLTEISKDSIRTVWAVYVCSCAELCTCLHTNACQHLINERLLATSSCPCVRVCLCSSCWFYHITHTVPSQIARASMHVYMCEGMHAHVCLYACMHIICMYI